MLIQRAILRIILNVFNAILFFSGIVLFVLAILLEKSDTKIQLAEYTSPIFICACLFVVLVLIGCLAICTGASLLLFIYAIGIIVVGALTIFAGCVILGLQSSIQDKVDHELKKLYENSERDDGIESLAIINTVQHSYQCCGYNGPNDPYLFPRGIIIKEDNKDAAVDVVYIMASCCGKGDTGGCPKAKAFKTNCKTKVNGWIKAIVIAIGSILIILGIADIVIGLVTFFSR